MLQCGSKTPGYCIYIFRIITHMDERIQDKPGDRPVKGGIGSLLGSTASLAERAKETNLRESLRSWSILKKLLNRCWTMRQFQTNLRKICGRKTSDCTRTFTDWSRSIRDCESSYNGCALLMIHPKATPLFPVIPCWKAWSRRFSERLVSPRFATKRTSEQIHSNSRVFLVLMRDQLLWFRRSIAERQI